MRRVLRGTGREGMDSLPCQSTLPLAAPPPPMPCSCLTLRSVHSLIPPTAVLSASHVPSPVCAFLVLFYPCSSLLSLSPACLHFPPSSASPPSLSSFPPPKFSRSSIIARGKDGVSEAHLGPEIPPREGIECEGNWLGLPGPPGRRPMAGRTTECLRMEGGGAACPGSDDSWGTADLTGGLKRCRGGGADSAGEGLIGIEVRPRGREGGAMDGRGEGEAEGRGRVLAAGVMGLGVACGSGWAERAGETPGLGCRRCLRPRGRWILQGLGSCMDPEALEAAGCFLDPSVGSLLAAAERRG